MVPYQLRRSARARRLRISVRPGGVEVVAPLRMREADIAAFVEQNHAWIDAKLGALRRVLAAHPGSARLIDGSTILYRGRPVRLRVGPAARPQVREAAALEITVPAALEDADRELAVERILLRWLRWAAQNDALAYVERHGEATAWSRPPCGSRSRGACGAAAAPRAPSA